jgi:adenosylhomocysteine nucleosidase
VGDVIIATNTLEHDFNNKFSNRPKPRFVGDTKSIEQIKALNISDMDFSVHFGIIAGGDEDVTDIQRGAELR